jgi:hypothetical protein
MKTTGSKNLEILKLTANTIESDFYFPKLDSIIMSDLTKA